MIYRLVFVFCVFSLVMTCSSVVKAETIGNLPKPCMWYPDCDKDGYGNMMRPLHTCFNPNRSGTSSPTCEFLRASGDCDDENATIHPGAREGDLFLETMRDGVDNDCDGYVDIDCDGASQVSQPWVDLRTPERGIFTQEDSISVGGVVYPSQYHVPIESVRVGGRFAQTTPCSSDGGMRFSATVPLDPGLQTIPVWAEDRFRRIDEARFSVIHSNRFINFDDVSGALVTLLNQGSWDLLADYLEGLMSKEVLKAE